MRSISLLLMLLAVVVLGGCSLVGGRFAGTFEGFGVNVSIDTEVGQIDIDGPAQDMTPEPVPVEGDVE